MGINCHSIYFQGYDLDLIGTFGPGGKYPIYSNLLDVFADTLRKNIKNGHQNVVVANGGTGSGKSTLLIDLCYKMSKDWKLTENYIYSLKDLKRKLSKPDSSPISLFDEGSVSLNSFNSQRAEDKAMSVLFDTMRSWGWSTFIAIPSFNDLNKRVRNTHVDYRLICPRKAPLPGYDPRGFFHVYKKIRYDLTDGIYWQHIGTGLFKKLAPRYDREYQTLKHASQVRLINEFIAEDD